MKSIIGLVEEIHGDDLNDDVKELLSYANSATIRMSQLIKALLEYGKIGQRGEPEKIDINETIQVVLSDLKDRIDKTEAKIITGEEFPIIYGYPVEVRLLFQNLIGNALKFHKENEPPVIKISAEKKNNEWEFCIADNGIGFPEEYNEKLFMIFKRLPTEMEYEGTGIGLAHSKKVVDLHEGKIWANSVKNQGSQFYFTLPLKKYN